MGRLFVEEVITECRKRGATRVGVEGALPGMADPAEFVEFEDKWTGSYVFENEWQSFRTTSLVPVTAG